MKKDDVHSHLRLLQLASEFGAAYPALAPSLGASGTDPDVERLLESMALSNGMLRRKLGEDFPLLVQQLAQLVLPHYPRPVPATTIMAFSPRGASGQSAILPAGTEIASLPVDGTACRFRTASALEYHPLELCDASFSRLSGRAGEIRLDLALKGLHLDEWRPKTVRLFLSGDYAGATELYLLLSRHLVSISIGSADGGGFSSLPADCLAPVGLGELDALLPCPPQAFPGYRLLQEYFHVPEKFLFFELTGWERWRQRGKGEQFSIRFQLGHLPSHAPTIRRDSFALNAVSAINLFSHEADPISVTHRTDRYPVRPAGPNGSRCQVFSVDSVTGYSRSTGRERSYLPFDRFGCIGSGEPSYLTLPEHPNGRSGAEVHLCLAFPGEMPPPATETLSLSITCSNGSLADNLRGGEIAVPVVSALPGCISARNITSVTPCLPPPCHPELLRHLVTHLALNQTPLDSIESLRALLEMYAFPLGRSCARNRAHLKRIAALESVQVGARDELVAGTPLRGREIRLAVREDGFAGRGDLFLFGCVLDRFLAGYAALQSFTRLIVHGSASGETLQWPRRLGPSHSARV